MQQIFTDILFYFIVCVSNLSNFYHSITFSKIRRKKSPKTSENAITAVLKLICRKSFIAAKIAFRLWSSCFHLPTYYHSPKIILSAMSGA